MIVPAIPTVKLLLFVWRGEGQRLRVIKGEPFSPLPCAWTSHTWDITCTFLSVQRIIFTVWSHARLSCGCLHSELHSFKEPGAGGSPAVIIHFLKNETEKLMSPYEAWQMKDIYQSPTCPFRGRESLPHLSLSLPLHRLSSNLWAVK